MDLAPGPSDSSVPQEPEGLVHCGRAMWGRSWACSGLEQQVQDKCPQAGLEPHAGQSRLHSLLMRGSRS